MNNRLIHAINTFAFIGLLGASSAMTLPHFTHDISEVNTSDTLFNGARAKQIEAVFDDAYGAKEFAVNLWAGIHYTVFSEGYREVVVGRDAWLFSAEEMFSSTNAQEYFADNVLFIEWVRDQLEQDGIALLVTPVPSKARVMANKLPRPTTRLHQQLFEQMLVQLRDRNINAVDSMAAVVASNNNEQLFFKNDTHWTPVGARLIAQQTAKMWRRLAQSSQGADQLAPTEFTSQVSPPQQFSGDLLNFIPVSPWFSSLGPKPESYQRVQTYFDNADLFSEPQINIALVGTSYSADARWNFDGALKQAMAADLINVARKGVGPFEPMADFMMRRDSSDNIKWVIWEIPERYLLMPFPKAYAAMAQSTSTNAVVAR